MKKYIINADAIKELMRSKKMNLDKLAELTDVEISTLGRIIYKMTKRPRIDTVILICDALGIDNIRSVILEK